MNKSRIICREENFLHFRIKHTWREDDLRKNKEVTMCRVTRKSFFPSKRCEERQHWLLHFFITLTQLTPKVDPFFLLFSFLKTKEGEAVSHNVSPISTFISQRLLLFSFNSFLTCFSSILSPNSPHSISYSV